MNNFISQNKAGLCIGGGLAFMLFGAGLAAIFSPKAVQAIEDKKEELGVDELPVGEKIKTSIGYYLPTIGFEILGASMILYGNQVNLRNEAAIMAAYAMNETALQITRDKIKFESLLVTAFSRVGSGVGARLRHVRLAWCG